MKQLNRIVNREYYTHYFYLLISANPLKSSILIFGQT